MLKSTKESHESDRHSDPSRLRTLFSLPLFIKSKIISELVFKSGLTDNAETNLRHRNALTDIDDFKMSRSKAVFLCDLRNDEDIKVAEVLYSVNFETLKMTQIRIHKWNTFPLFENGFASFLESDAGTGN